MDSNDIYKLVEHYQNLSRKEFTELHWVSQQEIMEESKSEEEEEVTAKQPSSSAIRVMLKARETCHRTLGGITLIRQWLYFVLVSCI
ncbi:hypothetical protein AVEN_47488-1 [Araneus ventricosus]|uniref:Uncharacterized protein n=1 Tax=Araneus ventricosus TaxID=182803 RepID=A0A4Y2JLK5_ARAVE|nr:hypothetical protein AVEN_47488-1 [Araneus ventricosus]